MNSFIKGLFIDLCSRIDKMITQLSLLSVTNPVASEFKAKTITSLEELKIEIDDVINGGTLDLDTFLSNNIINYNSFNNALLEIELFEYLAIHRIGFPEEYFEKLINTVYVQIECSQSVPFLSTISDSDEYFWAYPKYNMIALPQGEEKHLLNLSDLFHEIGHLIFLQYKDYLVGECIPLMKDHYEVERQRLTDDGQIDFVQKLVEAETWWEDSWSEEFACDLIATYLVGPAFAWTNIKMSTVSCSYNGIYSQVKFFREHPPDEARMRAVFRMLEITGFTKELTEIKAAWEKFLGEIQNGKPDYYDFVFTDNLINDICDNVFKGCSDIGLKPYSQQLKDNRRPISLIINETWHVLRNDPDNFNDWQDTQIKALNPSSENYPS